MNEEENQEERDYRRERDRKMNAITSPPEGEMVRVPVVWVLEAFTPSQIHSLRDGAERLGWTRTDTWTSDRNFLETISSFRSRSVGGGWVNLGYIIPEHARSGIFMDHRRAALPDGVERVHAALIQPFPSTTILCLRFEFDDAAATSLMPALMESYATYEEPIGERRRRIVGVEHQKQLAVELARAALRSLATEWVATHFPGHFAKSAASNVLPTCELMLFTKQEDFVGRASGANPDFLQMLSLSDYMDTWRSDDLPGLYLKIGQRSSEGASARAVVFANLQRALEGKDLKAYGADKEAQLINWFEYFDTTLATWAIGELAQDYIASIGRTRDEYARSFAPQEGAGATDHLKRLDAALSEVQQNAVPFAHDVAYYSRNERLFFHDVYEFRLARPLEKYDPQLFENTRQWLLKSAHYIQRLEEHLRFVAQQTARMISSATNEELSRSNLRLQRQIGFMTIIMLLLAVATAIEPLSKLWQSLVGKLGAW